MANFETYLRIKLIHNNSINPNRVRMRLKSCEKNRTGFVDVNVMLFVNAHPKIEVAREFEIEHEQSRDCCSAINFNFKSSKPKRIVLDCDGVAFLDADCENVIHGGKLGKSWKRESVGQRFNRQ